MDEMVVKAAFPLTLERNYLFDLVITDLHAV